MSAKNANDANKSSVYMIGCPGDALRIEDKVEVDRETRKLSRMQRESNSSDSRFSRSLRI